VIGEKDWASRLCNGWSKSWIEGGDAQVKFIPQDETKPVIGGHYFEQPDYQKSIRNVFEYNIQGKYEIY
jgi:hypothetical protein